VHDGDAGDQCEQVRDVVTVIAGRRVRGSRWMQYPVIQQQHSEDAKLKEVTEAAAAATVSAAALAIAAKCKCKINRTNTHNDTNWIQDEPVEMDDEPPRSEMLSAALTVSRCLSLHDPLSIYSPPHRAAQPLLQSSDACPTSWGLHRHIALFAKYSLLFLLLLAATAPYIDSCMSLMCLVTNELPISRMQTVAMDLNTASKAKAWARAAAEKAAAQNVAAEMKVHQVILHKYQTT
jgi:hypothetical protein